MKHSALSPEYPFNLKSTHRENSAFICSSRMAFTFVLRDKSKQKHAFSTLLRDHKIVVQVSKTDFFKLHFLLTFSAIGQKVLIDNFKALLLKVTAAE